MSTKAVPNTTPARPKPTPTRPAKATAICRSLRSIAWVSSLVLFRRAGRMRAHGRGIAGGARGEERDHGAHQRAGGEEIQARLELAGRILDPADDEGTEIA